MTIGMSTLTQRVRKDGFKSLGKRGKFTFILGLLVAFLDVVIATSALVRSIKSSRTPKG